MSTAIWAYRVGAFGPGNEWDDVISLPIENNLAFLISELERRDLRGEVTKLAIVAHGDRGGLVKTSPPMTQSSIFVDAAVCGYVSTLRDYLQPRAMVILISCMAGAGAEGTNFLRALSTFWPNRDVVGFTTSGEWNPYHTVAGDIFDTGMQISGGTVLDRLSPSELVARRMTERSNSSKWARNGSITRMPRGGAPT